MIDVVPIAEFFGIPDQVDAEVVHSYVGRLLDFSELAEKGVIRYLPSQHCAEELLASSRYPFITHMRSMFARSGVTEYSAEDLNHVLSKVLTHSASLEIASGIQDILWSNESIEPPFLAKPVCSHDTRVILSVALWKSVLPDMRAIVGIASEQPLSVKAAASIDLYEGSLVVPTPPILLAEQVLTASEFHVLLAGYDTVGSFKDVWSIAELSSILQIHVLKGMQRTDESARFADVAKFSFKERFLDSVDSYSFRTSARSAKLLRALTEVVLGQNLSGGHALRVSAGGGAPQRKRGNDLAWRYDIDYEFHLHVWMTAAGPEFVKIVPHNDFSIED